MSIFRRAAQATRGWASSTSDQLANLHMAPSGPVVPNVIQGATTGGVPPWIASIWGYYDEVGEFHFDSNFLAFCLSRCTLRLGVLDKENQTGPAFDEDGKALDGVPVRLANLAARMIANLRSAPSADGSDVGPAGGHGLLLGRTGANLIPAAECYWVATKTPMGDHWEVLSTMEMQPILTPPGERQKFRRRRRRGGMWEEFTPNFYLRVYLPHPCFSGEADTAALSLLSTLERLALLSAEGVADSKSRLKGPGVEWIPCLAGGTRVSTVHRGAVPIEEVESGEMVWSYDPNTAEMVQRPTTGTYTHQASETLIVATGNQRVQMTPHHRMARLRRIGDGGKGHKYEWDPEWAEACELREGDWLVCAGPLPDTGVEVALPGVQRLVKGSQIDPTELTPDLAWLLGVLAGDGHVSKRDVRLYIDGPAARRARQIVEDTWGIKGHDIKGQNGYTWTQWSSKAFSLLMAAIGQDANHTSIRIPMEIWAASMKHQQAYLDGLMDADGHSNSDGSILSLGLANEEMVRDARALFIKLGWMVSNISTFIGKDHDLASGFTVRATRMWCFEIYPNQKLRSYKLNHNANMGDALGPEWHLRKVRSIKPGGAATVYDLQVAGSANYLADGLVSHNSEIDFPSTDEDPEGDNYASRKFIETANIAIKEPDSASRHVPIVMRAPGDRIKQVLHQRFDYNDQALIEKRAAAVGDLARGVPLPYETTVGYGDTTFCVDDETEALTASGWKRRADLAVGDEVLTLNHRTGASEWQPIEAVHTFDVADEPMLLMQGKAHNSMTTAGHNWPVVSARGNPVRRWKTSAELGANHRILTAAPNVDVPTEPKWSDELAEIIGWFFTEGSIRRDPVSGNPLGFIHQSLTANADKAARIRLALTRLAGPPIAALGGTAARNRRAWREDAVDKGIGTMAVFSLSGPLTRDLEVLAPDRRPTPEFVRSLTAGQLELFINAAMAGDGWNTNMGSRVIAQNDGAKLDGLELACILSGRTPFRWTESETRFSYEPRKSAGETYERHYLCISEKTSTRPIVAAQQKHWANHATVEWVAYTGIVWCPSTANHTWMARRNGKVFFTGNSNAFAIEGQLANIFVSPMLDIITGFLTVGWLTKGLMDATGAPFTEPVPEDIRRLVVWYDVSGLVTDPDPTKVAQWAYGTDTNPNNIISAKGVRRLLAIPEAERPTPEETAERAERSQKLRARSEKGDNKPNTTPEDGKPEKDPGDGKRDKGEEVGKRVMALAEIMVGAAVDTAGSKLVGKCQNRPELKAKVVGVNAGDIGRALGMGVIESLGGVGPLFNGSFAAFNRTVTSLFVEAGREDAADLAEAATTMAKRAAISRLTNPGAKIDVTMAAEFLEQLNLGPHS